MTLTLVYFQRMASRKFVELRALLQAENRFLPSYLSSFAHLAFHICPSEPLNYLDLTLPSENEQPRAGSAKGAFKGWKSFFYLPIYLPLLTCGCFTCPSGPINERNLTLVPKNVQPNIRPRLTGKKIKKREACPTSQPASWKIDFNSEVEPHL